MFYRSIKKILLGFIPKTLLYKLEPFLRKLYVFFFFRGDAFFCPICASTLSLFIPPKKTSNDLLCPACGSLSRIRHLYDILQKDYKDIFNPEKKILHFTPQRELMRQFKKTHKAHYYDTDLFDSFYTHSYDIQSIDAPDKHFDYIICYHVLEHVKKDLDALKELKRVLKPSGICFLQVPLSKGNTIEEPLDENYSEEKRKHLYGQEDHVRWYGFEDFKDRIEKSGFCLEVVRSKQSIAYKKLGILANDCIFIARPNT